MQSEHHKTRTLAFSADMGSIQAYKYTHITHTALANGQHCPTLLEIKWENLVTTTYIPHTEV